MEYIPASDYAFIFYLTLAVAVAFLVTIVSYIVGYRVLSRPPSVSPYTKMPLRRASDLSHDTKERVLRYLYNMHQYDNQMFDFEKAALCRETGRIFPNTVTWYGTIEVDWTFINKRYPGNYVSWGSLSGYQKDMVSSAHHTLEGFQTEFSSQISAPSKVEPYYSTLVPGPLYVDLDTNVLLGWKSVPMTDLEVLIVQKPKGIFELPHALK